MLKLVTCGLLEDVLKGSFKERMAQLVKDGREDPELVLVVAGFGPPSGQLFPDGLTHFVRQRVVLESREP